MNPVLTIALAAVFVVCTSASIAADGISAEVIFRGTFRSPYESPTANEPPPPKIDFGFGWIGPRPREETNTVIGKKSLDFGLLFIPRGPQPRATSIKLRYITHFPDPGQLKPGAPPATSVESEIDCLVGMVCTARYIFDADWEIVPGPWRFEIYHGDTKIIDETIGVQVPPPRNIGKPNAI